MYKKIGRDRINRSERTLIKTNTSTNSAFQILDQFSSPKKVNHNVFSPKDTENSFYNNNSMTSLKKSNNFQLKSNIYQTDSNKNIQSELKLPKLRKKKPSHAKKPSKNFLQSDINENDFETISITSPIKNFGLFDFKNHTKNSSFFNSPKMSQDPLHIQSELNKSSIWKDLKRSRKHINFNDSSTFNALANMGSQIEFSNFNNKLSSQIMTEKIHKNSNPHLTRFTEEITKIDNMHILPKEDAYFSQFDQIAGEKKIEVAGTFSSLLDMNINYSTKNTLVEMTHGRPTSFNFAEKNNYYAFIKCKNRELPAYIVSDRQGLDIEYFINFVTKDYNVKKNKINVFKSSSPNKNDFKIKSKNQVLPSEYTSDLTLSGDYVKLEFPESLNEKMKIKDCEILLLQIVSQQSSRVSMTITFSNVVNKKSLNFEAFSNKQKQQQFGVGKEVDEINTEIKNIKTKKQESSWLIRNNIKKISNFVERKQQKLESNAKILEERTLKAARIAKENWLKTKCRHQQFQLKNHVFKEQKKFKQEEKSRYQHLYYQMYFWCFMLKFYKVMSKIYAKYIQRRKIAMNLQEENLCAIKIQRRYRIINAFFKNKKQSNREICAFSFNLRCLFSRKNVRRNAKKAVGHFFKKALRSWRLKTETLAFIQQIKNIQKRVKEHIKIKRKFIKKLEASWQKQVMYIVQHHDELKNIGFDINLEHLQFVSSEIRDQICEHFVERQLLRFADSKMAHLEKVSDLMLEEKARRVSNSHRNVKINNSSLASRRINDVPIQKSQFFIEHKINHIADSVRNIDKQVIEKKCISPSKSKQDSSMSEGSNLSENFDENSSCSHKSEMHDVFRFDNMSEKDILKEENFEKKKLVQQLKLKNNFDVDHDNLQQKRIAKRKRRQTKMAETGDFNFRKSFKELVKKIKQYQYNSVRFWNKLDNTFEAEIFKTAITRSPEIIEAKLQFEKEQKLLEEKLLKEQEELLKNGNKKAYKKTQRQLTKKKNIAQKNNEKQITQQDDNMEEEVREIFKRPTLIKILPDISAGKFDFEIEDEIMQAIIISTMEHCKDMNSFRKGIQGAFLMGLKHD